MPGDVNYAYEKYSAARDILAEGTGSRQDRLVNAYGSQGHRVIPLRRGLGPAISEELAIRIQQFHARLTADTTIEATIAALSDDAALEAIQELLAIASALDSEYHAGQVPH